MRRRRARRVPRILLIIENVPLARDHRARKQVDSLRRAGYEVSVICRRDPGNVLYRETEGVKLYEYPPPPEAPGKLAFLVEYVFSWAAALVLAVAAALDTGFDVIQAGHPPDLYAFLALPFKLTRTLFVVDQRDLSPELYATRYGRDSGALYEVVTALEHLSWRAADHIFTVNRSLERTIVDRGGVPPRKVTIVGNGPVLNRTSPRPPRPELREGMTHMACWVGLMGPQDRVDLALDAVDHLVHAIGREDCLFVFIGDGEVREDLRQHAGDIGLGPWVRFTGWLDEPDCFAYLANADLGIDPNLQVEVSPVKGLEYMAFGLPLVAFDLPQTREMAGEGGVYVPAGDTAAMAEAINRLLADPRERGDIGAAGRARIEEHLSWDRQEEAYLGALGRLIERRPASTPRVETTT